MKNLTITHIENRSFCDQLVKLESEDFHIDLHVRKSEMFLSQSDVGKEVDLSEIIPASEQKKESVLQPLKKTWFEKLFK